MPGAGLQDETHENPVTISLRQGAVLGHRQTNPGEDFSEMIPEIPVPDEAGRAWWCLQFENVNRMMRRFLRLPHQVSRLAEAHRGEHDHVLPAAGIGKINVFIAHFIGEIIGPHYERFQLWQG